jgi:predicted DNA binding CopG/RHH family protein
MKGKFIMKKLEKIPEFKNEIEESEFWSKHDSTDFIDWSKSENTVMPELKPTTKSISLRLPEFMINNLKSIANKMDIPYQSLIKIYLQENINRNIQA